jgi:hypothetical protein
MRQPESPTPTQFMFIISAELFALIIALQATYSLWP